MEHKHSVFDTDTHFTIDPVTRQIKNASHKKTTLMQFDHNSERFTFECPRYIEAHDMAECNRVEVHYLNIDGNRQNSGVYAVDDLQVMDGDETQVTCSWVISSNATQLAGALSFLLRFLCVDGDIITYSWNTDTFTAQKISKGIDASGAFETEYVDVIEKWKASVMDYFSSSIAAWKDETSAAIRQESTDHITALVSYVTPEMFGAVGDGVTDDYIALKQCFDSGKDIRLSNAVYVVDAKNFYHDTTDLRKCFRLKSNVTVHGDGATIRVVGVLSGHAVLISTENYTNPAYRADAEKQENIAIYDLNIDGGSISETYSLTGLAVYRTEGFSYTNGQVTNLSGNTGDGYGFIGCFSKGVYLRNIHFGRSDRSNIYVWECKEFVGENLICDGSYFRDCITTGTNTPVEMQTTHSIFRNCEFRHKYGTGTHIVRFSGEHEHGLLDGCVIESMNAPLEDGIYITSEYPQKIDIRNCYIKNTTYGIRIQSENENKFVSIDNCFIEKTNDAIYSDANFAHLKITDCVIRNVVRYPIYITSAASAHIAGCAMVGGTNLALFMKGRVNLIDNYGEFDGTSANTAIITSADATNHPAFAIIRGNVMNGKCRVYTDGIALGNKWSMDSSTLSVNENNL